MKDMNAEDLRAYNRNRQREYREKQKKKSEEEKKKSEEKKKKSEMNKQYYAVCKKKQEAMVLWDKTNDPATPKPVDTPKHEPSSLLPLSQSSFDLSQDTTLSVGSSLEEVFNKALVAPTPEQKKMADSILWELSETRHHSTTEAQGAFLRFGKETMNNAITQTMSNAMTHMMDYEKTKQIQDERYASLRLELVLAPEQASRPSLPPTDDNWELAKGTAAAPTDTTKATTPVFSSNFRSMFSTPENNGSGSIATNKRTFDGTNGSNSSRKRTRMG